MRGIVAALWASALGWLTGCERHHADPSPQAPSAVVTVTPLTNMVPIAAGSFTRLNQRVTLTHGFWLGRYEVTQAEYAALTGTNPSHFTGDNKRPVEKVSQAEAAAYCAALTRREQQAGHLPSSYVYRLPTEAEWEYACRAGSTNRFSFGDREEDATAYAWTQENSEMTPHPVGLKQPNAWGLYDMHGNVWEWCSDWYADYSGTEATDPVGPAAGQFKVFRGGGWNNEIKFARCSNRFMMEPTRGIHFVGFRLALGRQLPPPPPSFDSTNQPPAAAP